MTCRRGLLRVSVSLALTLLLSLQLGGTTPTRADDPEPSGMPSAGSAAPRAGASATTPLPYTRQRVEVLGELAGYTKAVAVQGSYAYLGMGYRLVILDVADPTRLTIAGKTARLPWLIEDVAISGSYAYIADGSAGLHIVDVSNPSNPTEVGTLTARGDVHAVATAGIYAYVLHAYGLDVVDVANPASPAKVGSYAMNRHDLEVATDVVVVGRYAYLTAQDFWIVDVSNPAAPAQVGRYDPRSLVTGVAVSGSLAYITTQAYGLFILDIRDPGNLAIVGSWTTSAIRGRYGWKVGLIGTHAYVFGHSSALWILDVTDPSKPVEIAASQDVPSVPVLAVVDQSLYVGSETGLRIFDASSPASPVLVGSFLVPQNFNPFPHALSVSGVHAYMASGRALAILDVSDTTRIATVSTITTTGDLNALAVAGGYAYLAEQGVGLSIVDVSDPAKPAHITAVSLQGEGNDIALASNRGYVTTSAEWIDGQRVGGGLRVLDLSNLASPTVIGRYDSIEGGPVAVSGSLAYMGSGDTLYVLDVADPANPAEIGHYTIPLTGSPNYGIATLAISGQYAYVAQLYGGVHVLDVADPGHPTPVGRASSGVYDMAVSGRLLWLARTGGLAVVDVSNPASPVEVGFYQSPTGIGAVAIDGSRIYAGITGTGDSGGGLLVLRLRYLTYVPLLSSN